MDFYIIFVILTAFTVSSASFQSRHESNVTNDRIVGGQTAKRGQFPYIVSIRHPTLLSKVPRHRCGGGIISKRWVLSAAHCTSSQYSSPIAFSVHAGVHNITNDGYMYRIDRIVNHPMYDSAIKNADLSLLRTAKEIQVNDVVQVIPFDKHVVIVGSETVVSGWGRLQVRSFL